VTFFNRKSFSYSIILISEKCVIFPICMNFTVHRIKLIFFKSRNEL